MRFLFNRRETGTIMCLTLFVVTVEQVGMLLEHTVGNLDPLYIVSLVPDGLEIPKYVSLEVYFAQRSQD